MIYFLHLCTIISLIFLSLAVVLIFLRLLIGPSLPDRVAALDIMSMLVICIIAVFAISTKHSIYLDIAIALALISFLGTVAFAQFIEFQLSHHAGDNNND